MVKNKRLVIVLTIGSIIVLNVIASLDASESQGMDEFVGLCVYSSGSFSVLSNGSESVSVSVSLVPGYVYRVKGILYRTSSGLRMRVKSVERDNPDFELDMIAGAYWCSLSGCYILTPKRVKLGFPIRAEKGELIRAEGIWHGTIFYPVRYLREGLPKKPEDGFPWVVEGTVIYNGTRTILWNGSERIRIYLPYGVELKLGSRIKVRGLIRFYSELSLLVESREDVEILGEATKKDFSSALPGDIAVGNCTVLKTDRSLKLDCTDKPLYGVSARVGDVLRVNAVVRPYSLYCLDCSVIVPRENMPNAICRFEAGEFGKITGRVKWVRVYRNGFGIANVTENGCWVLLKLRKSIGIYPEPNQTVTAYGFFTTYRGFRAFEVQSGDDLCLGSC